MWFSRRVVYLAALVLAGCSGGGDDDDSVDPVPVPGNVSATAGYETVTLSWDAVPGATGYRVYVGTVANTPIDQLTPMELASPPLVETGLTNWQTRYYRVTARIDARESDPSAEVSAMPEGGYLISERRSGATYEVAVFRSDAVELGPIHTIPGGRLSKSFGTPRVGIAWGVPGTAKHARLGVFITSTPLVLGEESGHEYEFIDLIPTTTPRLAWIDCASTNGTNCGVSTALLDGTDVRSIKTGCDSIGGSGTYAKVGTAGIAFRCTEAGEGQWWFSDGVAAAFQLAPPSAPDTRTLEALMPTRAIFRHPTERHLTTQPLVAGSVEAGLLENDSATIEHDLLKLPGRDSFDGRLLVRRLNTSISGSGRYELRTVNELGFTDVATGGDIDLEIQSVGSPYLVDASPDGTRFVAIIVDKDGAGTNDEAWGFAFASGDSAVSYTEGNAGTATDSAFDAKFTADGKLVINHVSDAWNVFDPVSGLRGADIVPSPNYIWAGTKGRFFYLYTPAPPEEFIASNSDGTLFDLSDYAPDPQPVHRDEGVVLFVDGNYAAWSAIYSPATNQFVPTLIDDVDTVQIQEAGDGPGNRTFLVMTRYDPTEPLADLVVYDIENRASPAVPLLADPAANETGFFVAD